MAKYRITGPDGGTYEITAPDEAQPADVFRIFQQASGAAAQAEPPKPQMGPTREEAFRGTIAENRASIAGLPEGERPAALKEWATTEVGRESKRLGNVRTVDDKVRQFARGSPIGSWLDELNGLTMQGAYNVTGGRAGAPYDETVAYNRARDEHADNTSTKLGSVPVPFVGDVDVTTGGLTKLAGGVASIAAMPSQLLQFGGGAMGALPVVGPAIRAAGGTLFKGKEMLPQMGNLGAQGAVWGGAYGAGEGEGNERIVNAGWGAGLGGAIGSAAPPVARGISRALTPSPKPAGVLADMDRAGVSAVADDVVSDALPARYLQEVRALGPEAALGDMGHNLRTTTGALARLPGEGQATIKNMVYPRSEAAAGRIAADVDQAMGPATDLVAAADATRKAANQAARPYYKEFESMEIPLTPAFQRLLDRAHATGAVTNARELMTIEGYQPGAQMTGKDWDYIRRGVSRLAETAKNAGDHTMFGAAGGLAKRINASLDIYARRQKREGIRAEGGEIPKNTELSPYANARQLSGEGQQFEAGVEAGADAFKKNMNKDQVRADLNGMASRGRDMERTGYNMGARGAIRDIAENSGTMYGPNGESAALRALGNEAAREKLTMIAGPDAAKQLLGRFKAEMAFNRTKEAATGNSVTSQMTAAQKRFGNTTPDMPQLASSLYGTAERGVRWLVNKMTAGALDEKSRAMAADAARILSAQGEMRDAYMWALTDHIRNRNLAGQKKQAAEQLLRIFAEGARAPATEAATAPQP